MLRSRFAVARARQRPYLLSVQPEVGQPVSMDRDVVQPNERETACTLCRHKISRPEANLSAYHGPQHQRPSQGGTVYIFMYIYTHTHLYACIYFYVYIHTYTFVCMHVFLCVCVRTHAHACVHITTLRHTTQHNPARATQQLLREAAYSGELLNGYAPQAPRKCGKCGDVGKPVFCHVF